MIILRQKNYSSGAARALAKLGKLTGKSSIKSKRDAIKLTNITGKDIISGGLNKLEKGRNTLENIAYNPGRAANRVIEESARRPVLVASNAVGKATMITNPTGVGLLPIGTVGTAAEVGLRKKFPKYVKFTDKLANSYKNSKASNTVENGVNAMVNYFKYM